ncbi:MAG: bifunctional phosphopantothenoylcysteine decarboxylase/phosphopantothenate--cysteine ligase CoaBC [Thermoplasmatota archaeon]
MHPSEHLRGSKGEDLKGKKIVLGVTGSIAAVECVKLIRELVREGAEVHCVMTEWATKIVHPYSLEFASGNRPVTELTGQVEHVSLCGKVPAKADLFLIAPATANTVSKIAQGIDDTPVTTFATTCIGSNIPIILVPAMHESMYDHPIVMDNLKKIQDRLDITVVGPRIEEGAAKVAERDQIVDAVIRELDQRLEGKRITVITGRTEEPIDTMRVLTNKATGKSGIEIAKRAYRRGADVELWHGNVRDKIPHWIPNRKFEKVTDLLSMAGDVSEIVIVPAALSDFSVDIISDKKLSSSKEIELSLKPLPKFIDRVRDKAKFLVAYKAEDTREKAIEEGKKILDENRADMVVANSLKDIDYDTNRVYILPEKKCIEASKRRIAEKVLDYLECEV